MASNVVDRIKLEWQNFSSTLSSSFLKMRNNSELFDVTLACASNTDKPSLIKAHRLVLAACSEVLKHLILNLEGGTCKGIIYLSGIEEEHLLSLINFMYSGEVEVERSKLERFLQVAEELKVEVLVRELPVKQTTMSPKQQEDMKDELPIRAKGEKMEEDDDEVEEVLTVRVEEKCIESSVGNDDDDGETNAKKAKFEPEVLSNINVNNLTHGKSLTLFQNYM